MTYNGGETWVQQQTLLAADGAANDWFGWSVAIHNSTIVVGALHDDNEKGGSGVCIHWYTQVLNISVTGSAYVYLTYDSGHTWSQTQKLVASNGVGGVRSGIAVTVQNDTIVVGAQRQNSDKGTD